MKVMLVTQQEDTKRVASGVVGPRDEVFVASDLATGLSHAVEAFPELVVIDLGLAGGAALAMTHHVMAANPKTSIHVLAAPGQFEMAAEAMSLGAAGILVAPLTGDALLRVVADIQARLGTEERMTRLAAEARDASELVDAMTQALLVARARDARALAEALLTTFLVASGARGVAIYGEETDGVRKRTAAYGTALELLDRYTDVELAQLAVARQAEVVSLGAHGSLLLERPNPARTSRLHRAIEFAIALLSFEPTQGDARSLPRPLPLHVFERLVQRDAEAGAATVLCAVSAEEVEVGPLVPALAVPGAAIGASDAHVIYALLPKTEVAAARALLVEVRTSLGFASAPTDGTKAADLLALARARATQALAHPWVQDLRARSLREIVEAMENGVASRVLDAAPGVMESTVLHACLHARHVAGAEVIVGHGPERASVLSAARGGFSEVRAIALQHHHADLGVALVLTPRASWGLVARSDRTVSHTADPLLIQLLRNRLLESSS